MQDRFGSGLTVLYIAPATNKGMSFITHIMRDDLVNYRRHLCKQLCETGKYIENGDMPSKPASFLATASAIGLPATNRRERNLRKNKGNEAGKPFL